jgi:ABC-type transport system involved in multi-copper enzyme maturation permease subunit
MRAGGGRWEHVPNYLISVNRQVVLLQNKIPLGLPSFGPSERDLSQRGAFGAGEASIILAIYTVAFLVVAFVVYRRRDINAASNG